MILAINMVLVAGVIWVTPGVTIGNPYGRIALGATTGKDEIMFSEPPHGGVLQGLRI